LSLIGGQLMKQNSLFKNLPGMSKNLKEINKQVIDKANKKEKRKVFTGRNSGKSLHAKIEIIRQTAREKLIDDGQVELIDSKKKLQEYIEIGIKEGTMSIDTETTGLDPIQDELVGISLKSKGQKQAYIPIKHTDLNNVSIEQNVAKNAVFEAIKACIDNSVGFIMHNAKFDMRVIKNQLKMNDYIKCDWDTQIAGKLLNEMERHGLKQLWTKYVSKGEDEAESFDKLFNKVPFNYVPLDIAYIYAGKDALMTYELYEFQKEFLNRENDKLKKVAYVHEEIELPIIEHLCKMEDYGIGLDDDRVNELANKYESIMDEVNTKAQEQLNKIDLSGLNNEQRSKLGNPINISSSQQMAIIIYDALGYKSPERNNPRGTGEPIIHGLREKYPQSRELFDSILEHRGVKKLLSTYINKLPKEVKESTNKIHTQLKQYGGRTGRFSSEAPNLQNIPSRNDEIRTMFVPSKGTALISCDYSQQEPRVLAHLCSELFGDNKMKESYINGWDLYSLMASEIYNRPYEKCGKSDKTGAILREQVKSILLGLLYGRGVKSIAEQLDKSVQETNEIIDTFFMKFPAIKQTIDYCQQFARTNGYVETVYGRKRRLPEINLPDYEYFDSKDRTKKITDKTVIQHYTNKLNKAWFNDKRKIKSEAYGKGIFIKDNGGKIAEAERQCLNSVIQGTAADITKLAMKEIGNNEELKEL